MNKQLPGTSLDLPLFPRPGERWEILRARIRSILEEAMPDPRKALERQDPIVRAIMGYYFAGVSAMERSLVTKLGMNALRLVEPWFQSCQAYPYDSGFWSGKCTRNWRRYTVKVTLSPKMNSTLKSRVARESEEHHNPVVLSLSGYIKGHYEVLGKAYLLDGYYTWYWLTGDRNGYKTFLQILREEARPIRDKILDRFHEERRKQLEKWRRDKY